MGASCDHTVLPCWFPGKHSLSQSSENLPVLACRSRLPNPSVNSRSHRAPDDTSQTQFSGSFCAALLASALGEMGRECSYEDHVRTLSSLNPAKEQDIDFLDTHSNGLNPRVMGIKAMVMDCWEIWVFIVEFRTMRRCTT